MRLPVILSCLCLVFSLAGQVSAQENEHSGVIVEKMTFKFVRGVTNATTCIVELPKQTYLMTRDRGGIGVVAGPLKGLGMTLYRAFSGVAETALFLVPQPGYYDSMITPEFVWKGWEDLRSDTARPKESEAAEGVDGKKEPSGPIESKAAEGADGNKEK